MDRTAIPAPTPPAVYEYGLTIAPDDGPAALTFAADRAPDWSAEDVDSWLDSEARDYARDSEMGEW